MLPRVHIDHVKFNHWGKQSELMWHQLLFHPFRATEMYVLARIRVCYTSFSFILPMEVAATEKDAIEGDR